MKTEERPASISGKSAERRNLRQLLFALLITLSLSTLLDAQNAARDSAQNARNIHQWGAISIFHGLPSDHVYAVAQDRDGVMWFGTERGLAKYDGRRVQTVTAEGLPANRISALRLAPDGALWIGTETGAVRLSKNQFQLIEATAGKTISAIVPVPERDSVMLASLQGQIFECSAKGENAFQVKPIPAAPLTAADNEPDKLLPITSLIVNEGVLLAGTRRRGLLHLAEDRQILGEIMSRPRAFFINALAKNAEGKLWLATDAAKNTSGLFLANDVYHPENIGAGIGTVTTLGFDANDDLWLGTIDQGAFHFRGRQQIEHLTFENTAGGLRSNYILTIFVDRENVIWFGTDRGVFRFDPNAPRNEVVAKNAESDFVRTLFQMRAGRIFAGTNRGLFSISGGGGQEKWHENSDFTGKTIFGVAETDAGQLLVGTANGLFANGVLQSPAINNKKLNDSVRAIRQFQNKIYLASFGSGLEEITNNSRKIVFPFNEFDANLREVTALHVENNQKLWIGTGRSGVFSFDGKQFIQNPELDALKNAVVRAIDGSEQTGIWFATEKGLFVFQNGKLEAVLPATNTRSVYLEPNAGETSVWSATEKGLFHLKFDREFGWLVSRLEVEQGLPSQNIFAVLPQADGGLLIGTNRGVVRYQANKVKPLLIATRVVSQRLYQPDELADEIKLDFPQNSLALEVAAQSSRTYPEQFQYAFSLRDAGGNLLKKKLSNDSQFLLENLAAGDYKVEARSFDKDLQSSASLILNFSVARAPFPWTATILAVFLGLTLLVLMLVILQRNKIRQTSRQLIVARLDLVNEAERERRRIARDLHDQTLADLRHLQMLTDKFDDDATLNASEKSVRFRSEIENVSREVRRICEDLSPSVLENIGLAAALEWALQTVAQSGNFAFEFVADDCFEDDLQLLPSVQIQIYRVAQEVLNNIARHAAASSVRLSISNADDFLLTIEDDGRNTSDNLGFSQKTNLRGGGGGRGVHNIKARAALIEAEISWQRNAAGKTVFSLRRANAVDSHNR